MELRAQCFIGWCLVSCWKGEASSGKHITSADAVRNLEWATSTCVLGFNVFGKSHLIPTHTHTNISIHLIIFLAMKFNTVKCQINTFCSSCAFPSYFMLFCCFILFQGIWPEGADGTDINAVCRSHDNNLLASADDFGKVHLFSNPCSQPRVSFVLFFAKFVIQSNRTL